jgi:hypothetical protein
MRDQWLTMGCAGVLALSVGLGAEETLARQGADDPPGHDAGNDRSLGGIGESKAHVGLPVRVEAPERNHRVGIDGRGWIVDLALEFDVPLAASGFTLNAAGAPGFQITGPGGHNDIAPMPGTFSAGADERLPGLIVLLTTTAVGAGSCQNLANLFNLTGITDLKADEVEIWDTWIVGAPNFGTATPSTLFVAVAADLNGDGIYNDAPAVIPDADGDGLCTQSDFASLGVASNIEQVNFSINGAVDLSGLPTQP